jgi:hypothetical protein
MRAGLTQDELSELSGLEVIEACGFTIPLLLAELDTSLDGRLDKNRHLSPERRAARLLKELDKAGDD